MQIATSAPFPSLEDGGTIRLVALAYTDTPGEVEKRLAERPELEALPYMLIPFGKEQRLARIWWRHEEAGNAIVQALQRP